MIRPCAAIRDLILTPKLMKTKDHLLKRHSPLNPFSVAHFLGREGTWSTRASEPSTIETTGLPAPLHVLLWFTFPDAQAPDFGFAGAHHVPSYPWAVGHAGPSSWEDGHLLSVLSHSPSVLASNIMSPEEYSPTSLTRALPLKSVLMYVTPLFHSPLLGLVS